MPERPFNPGASSLDEQATQLDAKLLELIQQRTRLEVERLRGTEHSLTERVNWHQAELDRILKLDLLGNNPPTVRVIFSEILSSARQQLSPFKVAYLGPESSYSHLAAAKFFSDSNQLLPVASISIVFEDVANGVAQFGVVPLENSTDGRISDTMQMFVRKPVKIAAEIRLRIHHALLGKGALTSIKRVCSKPQAISQCRHWLATHLPGVEVVETKSTTIAAQLAKEDEQTAAIASRQAGAKYGLALLQDKIQDRQDNVTRFAVISNQDGGVTGKDLTCLLLEIPHRAGALAEVMNCFQTHELNLTWIESFPANDSMSKYLFFVEFEGHRTSARALAGLEDLRELANNVEILGSYAATKPVDG